MNERYHAVSSQPPKNRIESAEAILINNRKGYEWNRYLKTVLHLPDWGDLGLENSTHFESYDHPWYLAQSRDFFGSSGLRDPTGQAGTSLGQDVELRAQWEISSNWISTLDTRIGSMDPISTVPPSLPKCRPEGTTTVIIFLLPCESGSRKE